MAETTKIEWADSTANLWIGCTAISPACDHCYAQAEWETRRKRVIWGPHGDRSFCAAGWQLILRLQRAAANNNGVDPVLGRKRRIFVNSLSDFFDNHRSIVWRPEAFQLFEACPDIILILVTKRPENVIRMVPEHWLMPGGWPAHVWLMVTAEDQERYDHRWPILRDLPGPRVKALSIEPMLGPIELRDLMHLDWCIVGGESGHRARPMHPDWARRLRDQCTGAGVSFLFKQWGEWRDGGGHVPIAVRKIRSHIRYLDVDTGLGKPHPNRFSDETMIRLGKAKAGRLLDGRTWDEVPS